LDSSTQDKKYRGGAKVSIWIKVAATQTGQDSDRPPASPPAFDENEPNPASRFEVMDESHEPGERPYAWSFPQTYASADRAARLSKWLTQDGRFLAGNRALLDQFCAEVIQTGVPLSRAWLHIRTLHPEFAGVSRVWRRGMQTEERFLDFGFEKWPAYLD
jgi:hypothetical protein